MKRTELRRTPLRRGASLQNRKPLRRSAPLRAATEIPKTSQRRKTENRQYEAAKREFLAANRHCWRCGAFGTQLHHAAGREGNRLLVRAWWRALCPTCHEWATNGEPRRAIDEGWSMRRNGLLLKGGDAA